MSNNATSAFFDYLGTADAGAAVKLGCGHFGSPSTSVEYRGKRICPKCATLVMGRETVKDAQTMDGQATSQHPKEAQAQGSTNQQAQDGTQGEKAEGEGQDKGEADGESEGAGGDGKGKGQGDGDGEDSPVMHSEFDPAKQAKADKQRDASIKTLSQRMDGGQKEIELAKKAFDSHATQISTLQARVASIETNGTDSTAMDARLEKLESQRAKVIKIFKDASDKKPVTVEGLQHHMFALLLQTCSARLPDGHRMNIWLRGPAGSGKTTAAANVAKALGLQFAFNGALDSEYKLKGFIDATGKCVSTPFRKIWTEGGVYLFDEVDASLPAAVLGFNAALANARCDFPDANIERHKDCIIIAAANTFGGGATADYVGRAKQDAAFLDRFVQMDWDIDQDLETQLTGNLSWSKYVQTARDRVTERGLKGIIISPRASLFGASMIASGVPVKQVIEMTIYKGMTADQRKALALQPYTA